LELYIFRHGPAEERDPMRWRDDAERPLTEEGERETRRAAKGFARLAGSVDHIVSSPAVRALATARILAEEVEPHRKVEVFEPVEPGAPATAVLDKARGLGRAVGSTVIVGHEPTLGESIGLALTGEAVTLVRLSRAGAAALEFSGAVVPGGATLGWLLTRKQLMALAR
jgi:phosphohistidine phosphatase